MKTSYQPNPEFTEALVAHKKRLKANLYDLALIAQVSLRTMHLWLHGKAPHPLVQEGILARLAKEQPLTLDLRNPDMRRAKATKYNFL